MNFLLWEMTYLRYFIPLIVEGNKRGIKSHVFYQSTIKYSDPIKHMKVLNQLSNEYDFNLYPIQKLNQYASKITFFLEGQGVNFVKYKTKKISITSTCDFEFHYDKYILDNPCVSRK